MACERTREKAERGDAESEAMMKRERETKAVAVKEAALLAMDPGKPGGVAVRVCGITEARALPVTEDELVRLLRGLKGAVATSGYVPVCVLERAAGCEFAEAYGFLKGVLQALDIQVMLVGPQEWRAGLGSDRAASGTNPRAWKSQLNAEAQRRFPQVAVTHETAAALLMLDWALGPARKARLVAAASDTTSTPAPQPEPPCVTRFELAQLMQVSVRTVDRMIADGELRVRRVRGKAVRFLKSDVEEYLEGEK
jgi:excisionase family DNA binding protein